MAVYHVGGVGAETTLFDYVSATNGYLNPVGAYDPETNDWYSLGLGDLTPDSSVMTAWRGPTAGMPVSDAAENPGSKAYPWREYKYTFTAPGTYNVYLVYAFDLGGPVACQWMQEGTIVAVPGGAGASTAYGNVISMVEWRTPGVRHVIYETETGQILARQNPS